MKIINNWTIDFFMKMIYTVNIYNSWIIDVLPIRRYELDEYNKI